MDKKLKEMEKLEKKIETLNVKRYKKVEKIFAHHQKKIGKLQKKLDDLSTEFYGVKPRALITAESVVTIIKKAMEDGRL